MALTLSIMDQLVRDAGRRDILCPTCNADEEAAASREFPDLLHAWREPGFIHFWCVRCGVKGWLREDGSAVLTPAAPAEFAIPEKEDTEQTATQRAQSTSADSAFSHSLDCLAPTGAGPNSSSIVLEG